MKRALFYLVFAAGLAAAGETVELSAVSPRDAKITGALKITRLEALVTMRGLLAETQATLTLAMEADPAQRMEGRLVFPLPPDCVLTSAALDIGNIMRPASVTFKETAKKAYDSVVRRMLDPCLVQLLPDGRVSVQVFPFTGGAPRKLRLEFAQTVLSGAMWRFPLKFAAPVPEAVLKADAPVVLGTEERKNFSGGAEWSFTAPAEVAENLAAHPGGNNRWFFQSLLPPGEPAEPPRHLLLLAVTKGNESTAGTLIARQRLRENFTRLAAERAGLLREEMRPGPDTAPFLTDATAFIVLEQARDYERWNIPLPPDLARVESQTTDAQEKSDREAYAEFDKGLQRPAGTNGEPYEWYKRLRSDEKRSAVGQKLENNAQFEARRRLTQSLPGEMDWLNKEPQFRQLRERTKLARGELNRLAGRFRSNADEGAADLIEQARNQQQAVVELGEFLDVVVGDGMLHSGGGAIFAQTFGGANFPVPRERGLDYYHRPNSFSAQYSSATGSQRAGESNASARNKEILSRATSLHFAGKKPEAIRTLSALAIPGQHNHALLRLLAWVLLDWGEPAMALEVLEHAGRKFGSSDTTARDLALAEQAACRKDEALRRLRPASHHVARRDAAALDGRMSAALRIVLECAGDKADADLEIEGPDFELASWRNPLPAFGGALSFDGQGMEPEDFVLLTRPFQPLKVRVRLGKSGPQPVRVTVIEEWGRSGEKRHVFLLSAAQPGVTKVTEIDAAK